MSINDMAHQTMGPAGSVITSSTYILLTYTLMVAYISKVLACVRARTHTYTHTLFSLPFVYSCIVALTHLRLVGQAGDVLAAQLPFPVSPQAMGLMFASGFGSAIALGDIKKADELNRLLTLGMLSSFVLICGCGFLRLDSSQLLRASWADALTPIPVVFLSLVRMTHIPLHTWIAGDDGGGGASSQVYHDLVPVLCSYLEEDRHRIRQAIVFGSAIPLVMFISWEAVALGLTSGQVDGDPIQVCRATSAAFVQCCQVCVAATRALADSVLF